MLISITGCILKVGIEILGLRNVNRYCVLLVGITVGIVVVRN